WRWSSGTVEIQLTNTLPRPRRVTVRMDCVPACPESAPFRIESPFWGEERTLDGQGQSVEPTFVLPPGEHRLTLSCKGRKLTNPLDPRTLVFRVVNFTLNDLDEDEAPGGSR